MVDRHCSRMLVENHLIGVLFASFVFQLEMDPECQSRRKLYKIVLEIKRV